MKSVITQLGPMGMGNCLTWLLTGCVIGPILALSGCGEAGPVVPEFEPNWVFAYNMGVYSEQSMDQALEESGDALDELFGTPDQPKIPDFILEDDELKDLISMDKLTAASGSPDEAGRGLYRQHCVTCHGVTGNGRGATAALVNPYPRDYRLGKFKFKNTPIGTKPTKEDIAYLIKHGIAGTTMVVIPELSDDDIDALTDYVIYLSWRGEVERSLLLEASELFYEDGESLYDRSLKTTDAEQFEEQWELVQDFTLEVAEDWLYAADEVVTAPERDLTLVPDTIEAVLAAVQDAESPIKASVERGKAIFIGDDANCHSCHGKEGLGDGKAENYDDWATDWANKSRYGVDPADEETQIPLIARGALPPRIAMPRNFQDGIFRGGDTPEQIYQRITLGIEGTPMPAVPFKPKDPKGLTEQDVWDLVNFVRSMAVPKEDTDGAETESASQTGEKLSMAIPR